MSVNEPVKEGLPLTVLYDGACPLCRREIGIYRSLQPLRSDSPVCFADVSDAALPLPPGTTRSNCWRAFTCAAATANFVAARRPSWRCGPRFPAGVGWPWLAACRGQPG